MSWFDWIVTVIRRVLSIMPVWAQDLLWFPVFVAVVYGFLYALTRHLLPAIGRVTSTVLGWAVVAGGATLLLVDMVISSGFRISRLRPPGLVYAYGDIVSTIVLGLVSAAGVATSGFARLARVHVAVIVLCCGAFVWWWNQDHCEQANPPQQCVRPVASWMAGLGNVNK